MVAHRLDLLGAYPVAWVSCLTPALLVWYNASPYRGVWEGLSAGVRCVGIPDTAMLEES